MVAFRGLCGVEADRACVQLDAAGLKRLFSHGIRRFTSGSTNKVLGFKKKLLTAPCVLKKEINNLPTKGVLIDPFPRMKSLMSSTTFCELTGVSPKAPVASRRSLMMGMAMVMVLMMLVIILILVLCRWHPPSILNLPCPCLLQNQFPPVRKQQNLPALQRRKQRAQRASPRKFHQEARKQY